MVSVLQTILSLTHQIYPELWLNGVRNGLKSLISPFKFSALVSAKAFFMQRSYVCAATELQVSKIYSVHSGTMEAWCKGFLIAAKKFGQNV